MIAKFFELFGVAGTVSVVAWLAGGAMVAISLRSRRHRWRWMFGALAAAVAGVLLADVTHRAILKSTLDDREEVARAMELSRRAAAEGSRTMASEDGKMTMRFAEDSPQEATAAAATAAGVELPASVLETQTLENAEGSNDVTSAAGTNDDVPEYARKGKKKRAADKKAETKLDQGVSIKEEEVTVWYLKEKDYLAARKMDNINWLFSRLMFLLAAGMIVRVYLRAFNATWTTKWILPIGGHWLDNLSPRNRVVLIRPEAAGVLSPQTYASAALRRGENLIYFGASDPWAGTDRVVRLELLSRLGPGPAGFRAVVASLEARSKVVRVAMTLFRWAILGWASKVVAVVCRWGVAAWTRTMRVTRAVFEWKALRWVPRLVTYLVTRDPSLAVWRLACQIGRALVRRDVKKIMAGSRDMPPQNEFLLDGAWFGRYAVVAPAGAAPGVFADVVELLWERHATGASARQTVHLLWTLPDAPSGEILAALRHIAGGTNVKLVVWNGGAVPAELLKCYDEVCDTPTPPEQACRRRC